MQKLKGKSKQIILALSAILLVMGVVCGVVLNYNKTQISNETPVKVKVLGITENTTSNSAMANEFDGESLEEGEEPEEIGSKETAKIAGKEPEKAVVLAHGTNYASANHTIRLALDGSDNYKLDNANLQEENIVVKVNGTALDPQPTKTLTGPSNLDDGKNGKTYTLALSGVTGNGQLSVSIAANTLTDAAGNTNGEIPSTFNMPVFIDNNAPTIVADDEQSGNSISFTAIDIAPFGDEAPTGVIGYQITNSSTAPITGWTSISVPAATTVDGKKQTSSTISLTDTGLSAGTHYIWVMDGVGNRTSKQITVYYTITFDNQGATTPGTETSHSNLAIITPPAKTGYTFDGYYTQTSGAGTKYYNANGTIARAYDFTEDKTFYANWLVNHYSVQFDKNAEDATNTMANQNFTYNVAQNLTANAFERTGFSFAGWATSPDGAVVYTDEEEVSNLTTDNNGVVILYAKWNANPLVFTTPQNKSVTYIGNGTGIFKINAATNGTGNYVYTEVSEKNSTNNEDTNYFTISGISITMARNTPVGTYTYEVNVSDSLSGSTANATINITVMPYNISKAQVSSIADQTYNGSAFTPEPTLTALGGTLVKDTDYTLSYSNNTNPGTATITITGIGNYTGTKTVNFAINKITNTVEVNAISNLTYNTTAQSLVTHASAQGDVYYSLSGPLNSNNYTSASTTIPTGTDAQNYTVYWYTPESDYYAEKSGSVEVTISPFDISGGTIADIANQNYTGSGITPTPAVTITINGGSRNLTATDDFNYNYSNNTNPTDSAVVTANGTGNYTGSVSKDFTINPRVTFDANGGTGTMDNQNVTYNTDTALNSNTFTRTGFGFGGWNTQADGQGTNYADGANIKITSNTTLYAKWQTTLTIDPNGGTWNGQSTETTVTQETGSTYNIANNATRAGHIFGGWQLVDENNSQIMIDPDNSNIKYYDENNLVQQYLINSSSSNTPTVYDDNNNGAVVYTIKSDGTSSTGYSLEIKTNGTASPEAGGFKNSVQSSRGTFYYHKIVAKVPVGCQLMIHSDTAGIGWGSYWLTDNSGTGEWKTYIYAEYTGYNGPFENLGYISVNAQDNTNVTWWLQESSLYKIANDLSGLQSTNVNYTFATENQKLRAIWSESGSRLTFNLQGGTFGDGTVGTSWTDTYKDFSYNTTYSTTKQVPYSISRSEFTIYNPGYELDGWYTEPYGQGKKIFDENGQLIPSVSGYTDASRKWKYYTKSFTIYANWIDKQYTVEFNKNANDATGEMANQTFTNGISQNLTANSFSRDNYRFLGWSKTANGNVEYTDAQNISITDEMFDNLTLYAVWELITYTISFDANGGSGGQTDNVYAVYGSTMPTISTTAPTRTGYTFMGWYTQREYTQGTQYYTANGSSARNWNKTVDITLYAGWKVGQYTLAIDTNGGTWNGSTNSVNIQQDYGTTYFLSNDITKEGYVFCGWQLTDSDGNDINIDPDDSNIKFYNESDLVKQYIITGVDSEKPEIYNTRDNGKVTHTIISDDTSSTGYSLQITTNGSAYPKAGGFINRNETDKGNCFYFKTVAKIPIGYNLSCDYMNKSGFNGNYTWLTDNAGTGEWETYIYVVYTGYNGELKDIGGLCVDGTYNTNVTWWLQESSAYKTANNILDLRATNLEYKFIDENQYIKAKWITNGAMIKYDKQGGTSTSQIVSNSFNYGIRYGGSKLVPYYISDSDFTISKTGYELEGWYTEPNGQGTKLFEANGELIPSVSGYTDEDRRWYYYGDNFLIYANWIAKEYRVAADANGGSISSTIPWGGTGRYATKYVTYGKKYGGLPNVSRDGYTFTGWYTAATGGDRILPSTIVTATSDHDIYAQWSNIVQYTINANVNKEGATIPDTSGWTVSTNRDTAVKEVVQYDEYGTLPTPVCNGYTFIGWYTAETGGTQVTSSTLASSNKDIYAHWTGSSYTVTANANGGSISSTSGWSGTGITSTKNVTYGNTYARLPSVSRAYYTLRGWHGKGLFNEEDYLMAIDGATKTNNYYKFLPENAWKKYGSSVGMGDLGFNVNKKYVMEIQGYTDSNNTKLSLRFIYTDGSYSAPVTINGSEKTVSFTSGLNVKSIDITYETNNSNEYAYVKNIKIYEDGTEYEPYYITTTTKVTTAENHTITAEWKGYSYTVHFDKNDASATGTMDDQAFEYGTAQNLNVNRFKKQGYHIKEWRTNSNGTGTKYDDGQSVNNLTTTNNGTVTLYAVWEANVYRVTANANGGSIPTTANWTGSGPSATKSNLSYGAPYGNLPEPTRTGYTFKGWNGKNMFNIEDWEEKAYASSNGTITRSENSVTVASNDSDIAYAQSTYMIPVTPNKQYTLSWNSNNNTDNANVYVLDPYHMLNNWFYADQKEGKITFITGSNVESIVVLLYAKTSITYSNIMIEENYEPTTYETFYVTSTTNVTVDGEHTIKAIWKGYPYTVHFDKNDERATGTMDDQAFEYGTPQFLTSNGFSLSGHQFAGWNTAANGSGISYSNEESVNSLTSVNNGTVTLYAQWNDINYRVIANPNGGTIPATVNWTGTGASSYKPVVYDHPYGNLPVPSKTGYQFVGWHGKNMFDEERLLMDIDGVTKTEDGYYKFRPYDAYVKYAYFSTIRTMTFTPGKQYAITIKGHTDNNIKCTIGFYYSDQTFKSVFLIGDESTKYLVSDPTKDVVNVYFSFQTSRPNEYAYVKYIQVEENDLPTDYEPYHLIYDSTIVNTNNDHTIKAVWEGNTYTVHFDKNSDEAHGTMADQSMKYGDYDFINNNTYTRYGYRVNSWNTSPDGSGVSYPINEVVSDLTSVQEGEITLYAQWTDIFTTIYYDLNGGTGETPSSAEAIYNATMPTITGELPEKEGYIFKGWYDTPNSTGGTQYYDEQNYRTRYWDKTTTSPVTLYARWEQE